MEIIVSQEQGREAVAVVKVAGQLDSQTYLDLIAKTREIYEGGTRDILLDLEELEYVSSAGLISLHTVALIMSGEPANNARDGEKQKHVKLLNPRPEVYDILEMVGFANIFEIFTDKQKAVESF
ncbi:MAG: STAS domain-containing protein [Anaerolineales bacterium]|nr:STAS domain-containing protein [Anaerolineales bacterium]